MGTTTKEAPATKVNIKGRLSFPHLFIPTSFDDKDGKKKYQTLLLIDKKDKKQTKAIEAAIEAAKQEGKAKKWGGKIPTKLEISFSDGDEKDGAGDEFQNHMYVNAKSSTKPGLVKRVKGVEGLVAIESEDEMYAGAYVVASVNFYPYDSNGKKGIAAGLNNVLFDKDGERLAGRTSAEDDFAEYIEEETEDNDEDDDDDLMG